LLLPGSHLPMSIYFEYYYLVYCTKEIKIWID